MADKYITTKTGTRHLCQTTVGWKFLVEWANSSRQWIDLKLLEESNPVQVAEYVTARNIADEPAFAWWVPYVLRKRDVIISAINFRVRRMSHKYGIEVRKKWAMCALPLKSLVRMQKHPRGGLRHLATSSLM